MFKIGDWVVLKNTDKVTLRLHPELYKEPMQVISIQEKGIGSQWIGVKCKYHLPEISNGTSPNWGCNLFKLTACPAPKTILQQEEDDLNTMGYRES